jgi:hypothetical protein
MIYHQLVSSEVTSDLLEVLRDIRDCVKEVQDGWIEVVQSPLSTVTAERDALRAEVEALREKLQPWKNTARFIAEHCIVYLETKNREYPSHDTGEVLRAARHAIRTAQEGGE